MQCNVSKSRLSLKESYTFKFRVGNHVIFQSQSQNESRRIKAHFINTSNTNKIRFAGIFQLLTLLLFIMKFFFGSIHSHVNVLIKRSKIYKNFLSFYKSEIKVKSSFLKTYDLTRKLK